MERVLVHALTGAAIYLSMLTRDTAVPIMGGQKNYFFPLFQTVLKREVPVLKEL
jgi:hypothetical protein